MSSAIVAYPRNEKAKPEIRVMLPPSASESVLHAVINEVKTNIGNARSEKAFRGNADDVIADVSGMSRTAMQDKALGIRDFLSGTFGYHVDTAFGFA
jgi:hypothetical protein